MSDINWHEIPDTDEDLGDCIVGKQMPREFAVHQRTAPVIGWVQRADGYTHYAVLSLPHNRSGIRR